MVRIGDEVFEPRETTISAEAAKVEKYERECARKPTLVYHVCL